MSRAQHRVFEHVHTVPDRGNVVPAHVHGKSVTYDKVLERGIERAAWTIRVMRGSIANAAEMDALSDKLGISPPEMPFRIAVVIRLLHVPYCDAHQDAASKYPMPRNGANLDSAPCLLLHPPPLHNPYP